MKRAVVALSGGQDSTTCLYWALRRYDEVSAVSFDYGQRHGVELVVAREIARQAEVPHRVLSIEALTQLGDAGLTNPDIAINADPTDTGNTYAESKGLPSSFVPGRNLILLGLTAAYALPRGAKSIVTGVCATDRAGYPDCRAEFITLLEDTIQLGMDEPDFHIETPLLRLTKAATWALADELGCLEAVIERSHTCYEGERMELHPWGYGCGECGACAERAAGYYQWQGQVAA